MTVSAHVRNIGTREGAEVAQLYVRLRGTSVARPVRELKGFQRVELRPGESRCLHFTLGKSELAFWNADVQWAAQPAVATVWVAKDAHDGGGEGAQFTITA